MLGVQLALPVAASDLYMAVYLVIIMYLLVYSGGALLQVVARALVQLVASLYSTYSGAGHVVAVVPEVSALRLPGQR